MRTTLVVLLILGAASASGASVELAAQHREAFLPIVPPGSRVRLHLPADQPGRITGELVRVTPDSLEIRGGGARSRVIPLASVSRIERSSGRSHLDGALVGLATGVLVGGAVMAAGVLAGADLCIYVSCLRRDPAGAMGGFLIGGVVGAPVGIVVGAVIGSERWQPVRWALSARSF